MEKTSRQFVKADWVQLTHPPIWLLVVELLLFVFLVALALADEGRVYHRVLVQDIPKTEHTHVCTTGVVALVKKEADGDVHLRIEDGDGSNAFIVAEVIPTLLPKNKGAIHIPKKGSWVEVCGITREDKKHGWSEIHPVERLH